MSAPAVSVIIPVFNGKRFIRAAIDSVADQTLQPSEIILIDDGSSDGSLDLLEHIDTPFPKTILNQENRGQSASRNVAAGTASGTYLAFLDHDDIWDKRHLERLVEPLEADDRVGWAYSDIDEIDESGGMVAISTLRRLNPHVQHPKTDLVNLLGADMYIFPSAAVVRRDAFLAVGGFDERLAGYEDDDLFLRLFRRGWRNVFIDDGLVRYRRHAGSSVFSERMWKSREVYSQKLLEMFPDDEDLARFCVRDCIAPRFYYCARAEYLRYLPLRGWDECARALAMMRQFSELSERPGRVARAKRSFAFALMSRPRLFRAFYPVLRPLARLPRS